MTTPQQLRKIASRGRLDDMDVQEVFDAADEIEALTNAVQRIRDLSDVIGDSEFSQIYIDYLYEIWTVASGVLHD